MKQIKVKATNGLIGCNLRTGMVPGGFSHQFGQPRPNRHGSAVSDEVREAANRVLNDRRTAELSSPLEASPVVETPAVAPMGAPAQQPTEPTP